MLTNVSVLKIGTGLVSTVKITKFAKELNLEVKVESIAYEIDSNLAKYKSISCILDLTLDLTLQQITNLGICQSVKLSLKGKTKIYISFKLKLFSLNFES